MAITDSLMLAFLADYFSITTGRYKYICISTEVSSQTLSSALTAGAVITALPITATTAIIPAGQVVLDWTTNGVSPQEILTTSGCAAGATSLPVTSFTLVNNHAIGAYVVPLASATDNPSASPAGAQYLTLAAGDFGSASGSGAGNRQLLVTKLFPASPATAAGSYTCVRLCNANPIVAGSVGVTTNIPKAIINPTTTQTFTPLIKD